mgnify:CR=1 FL=1
MNEAPRFELKALPLPIVHSDFWVLWPDLTFYSKQRDLIMAALGCPIYVFLGQEADEPIFVERDNGTDVDS